MLGPAEAPVPSLLGWPKDRAALATARGPSGLCLTNRALRRVFGGSRLGERIIAPDSRLNRDGGPGLVRAEAFLRSFL